MSEEKKQQPTQSNPSAAAPTPQVQSSRVQIVKYAPPPPDLPMLGKVDPKDINFFGRTICCTF
jgi:16S rRNA A1518/A1519 N6-dimethyltransferase RsmA/KsgA/DIM1 with predicted DNA glycosylase/AP lyase activity